MKKMTFFQAMGGFVLMLIAVGVIVGDLNPGNTPSQMIRTLDEIYKNIQPGLPSDWMPYPDEAQVTSQAAVYLTFFRYAPTPPAQSPPSLSAGPFRRRLP